MYVEEFTGQKYAKAQMTWLVGKSERLPEPGSGVPKKAEIEVCRRFSRNEERMFGAVLVGCDEEVAPRRYVDPGKFFSGFRLIEGEKRHVDIFFHLFERSLSG